MIDLALELGCESIVNSSLFNYDKYEKIIGSILLNNKKFNPTIISKGGVINDSDKKDFIKMKGLETSHLESYFPIEKKTYWSLDEEVLTFQIENSLNRLGKDILDVFIVQYPEEYLISGLLSEKLFYEKIHQLMLFLEKMVEEKKIKEYGLSSSHFTTEEKNKIDLEKIVNPLINSGKCNHFRWVEFPLNLIERNALVENENGSSFLDFAKKSNLKTLSFRPLSAFIAGKMLRLATYEDASEGFNYSHSQRSLEDLINLIESEIIDKYGQITKDDYEFFTYLRRHWVELESFDQLDKIFNHDIPLFIGKLVKEKIIQEKMEGLYKVGSVQVRSYMTLRANEFRKKAVKEGVIPDDPDKELVTLVFDTYRKWKVDFVSLNIRKVEDIQKVKDFF